MMHLALYQPSIPPNTGAIARQCVGMGAHLHLIGPIAFDLSDHAVKRAGLDYWPNLQLTQHVDSDAFIDWLDGRDPWLVTVCGSLRYDQPTYEDGDVIVMGNELTGLPDAWHARWSARRVHIPMPGPVRSYNLANAAGIVLAHASLKAGRFDAMSSPAADGAPKRLV